MQNYDIKKGHYGEIEGAKLAKLAKSVFGHADEAADGTVSSSFGAIASIKVKLNDKNSLNIDTVMDIKVDVKTAEETRKKYNQFLEAATGFTSKERVKRLQKKAKAGKL